jgi:imidazolonepropionase-like amidohydrolase
MLSARAVVTALAFAAQGPWTASHAAEAAGAASGQAPPRDLVITHATVMTVTHGTIESGAVWVHDGKIAGVGPRVTVPPGATIVDAGGRYVTPGIIEAHAHVGMGGSFDNGEPQDTNEYAGKPWGTMAGPIQSDLRIRDSIKTDDYGFYLMLASGQTTEMELPGSANLFGGQAAPIKLKLGRPREEMFIKDAPLALKIACGGTPNREWKGRGVGLETDADVGTARRAAYDRARAYMKAQDEYRAALARGERAAVAPPEDLKLEAIAQVLRGKALLQMHCHTPEGYLDELKIAKDYGYTLRTIHHGTTAYKVAREIAAAGTGVLAISDAWGGAPALVDGNAWGVPILKQAGVRVSLHGEEFDKSRRLTQEAGKMLHYGRGEFTRDEALALVTLNAAWDFGLDDRLGSLDVGKDGDLVIWNGDPLSTYGHASQVFIEGELYFDETLPGLGLVERKEGGR